MTITTQTPAQSSRQRARSRSGQYEKHACEVCGRGAPMEYRSHGMAGPLLLVLCGRTRCAGTAAMNIAGYDEAVAYVLAHGGFAG